MKGSHWHDGGVVSSHDTPIDYDGLHVTNTMAKDFVEPWWSLMTGSITDGCL